MSLSRSESDLTFGIKILKRGCYIKILESVKNENVCFLNIFCMKLFGFLDFLQWNKCYIDVWACVCVKQKQSFLKHVLEVYVTFIFDQERGNFVCVFSFLVETISYFCFIVLI